MANRKYIPSESSPLTQKRLEQTFKPINDDISTGELVLQDIDLLQSQVNLLNHGLGREYQGFEIHASEEPVLIWEDTTYSGNRGTYLPLLCSTDCTVDIKVY